MCVEGPCGIKEGWCLHVCIDKEAPVVLAQVCGRKCNQHMHIWQENHWVQLIPFLELWTMSPSTSLLWDVDYDSMLMATYGGLTINPAQSDTMCTVHAGHEKAPRHSKKSFSEKIETCTFVDVVV